MIKKFENKKYFESITPDKLTLSEIPNIINQAYLDGVQDTDQLYRKSLQKVCKNLGIEFNSIFLPLLYELINNDENYNFK